MYRRCLLLPVLVAVLGVSVIYLALWLSQPRTAITRENATRIRPGMTLEEVEKIFNGASRDKSTGPLWSDESAGEKEDRALTKFRADNWWSFRHEGTGPPPLPHWISDKLIIVVALDEDGRVSSCDMIEVHRVAENPLVAVRRWLGL